MEWVFGNGVAFRGVEGYEVPWVVGIGVVTWNQTCFDSLITANTSALIQQNITLPVVMNTTQTSIPATTVINSTQTPIPNIPIKSNTT